MGNYLSLVGIENQNLQRQSILYTAIQAWDQRLSQNAEPEVMEYDGPQQWRGRRVTRYTNSNGTRTVTLRRSGSVHIWTSFPNRTRAPTRSRSPLLSPTASNSDVSIVTSNVTDGTIPNNTPNPSNAILVPPTPESEIPPGSHPISEVSIESNIDEDTTTSKEINSSTSGTG